MARATNLVWTSGRLVRGARVSAVFTLVPLGASAQTPASHDSLPGIYREQAAAMSTARFAMLWRMAPALARRRWDTAYAADQATLARWRDSLPAAAAAREAVRLRLRHVWGRTLLPYFHWREGDALSVTADRQAFALASAMPLADSTWWSLREHGELTGALVHERARELLRLRPSLQRGDVRWLRAEFAAAMQLFTDRTLQRRITSQLLITHLDENDERGVDSVRNRWLALEPDSGSIARVQTLVVAAKAVRSGHAVVTYGRRGDVPLELHVLRPTAGDTTGARPAMLWFHGGSGTTGSWSHSPGVVSALRANGVTVVAVEYRTGSRFDAGPVEQLEDAVAAWRYVQRHATELRVDANRIGAAGFSSGAGMALTLGTRGLGQMRVPIAPGARRYPAAVIVTGVCADPASAAEDGYFRRMVRRIGKPRDYAPLHLVAAGQPPTLLVHATNDEYCAFADARAFVSRSRAVGNDATLTEIEGATHFFGFYHRPGQEQMRQAIAEALRRWRWQTPLVEQ